MPYLNLEYSTNLLEQKQFPEMIQRIHQHLTESLPANLTHCKTKLIPCSDFVIGDGKGNVALMHAQLSIMGGRSSATLEKVGVGVMAILKQYLSKSAQQFTLDITLRIDELAPTYFKN